MDLDVSRVETPRKFDRALAPGDRFIPARCTKAVDREVGIRPAELAAGRQTFKQRDRSASAFVGFRRSAATRAIAVNASS